MLGRSKISLYGTRDAATNWQETRTAHLESIGFKRCIGYPSVYDHPVRHIWTMVHGDDYVSVRHRRELAWLESKLACAYEIKTQHIGPNKAVFSEGKVLNRVVGWEQSGCQLEADPRHAELILEQIGWSGGKGLSTLRSDDDDDKGEGDD